MNGSGKKKTPFGIIPTNVSTFSGSRPWRTGGSGSALPLSLGTKCVLDCAPTFARQSSPRTRPADALTPPCTSACSPSPYPPSLRRQSNCAPASGRLACPARSGTSPVAGSFGNPSCPLHRPSAGCQGSSTGAEKAACSLVIGKLLPLPFHLGMLRRPLGRS